MSSGPENGVDGNIPTVADTASYTNGEQGLSDAAAAIGRALDGIADASKALARLASVRTLTDTQVRRMQQLNAGIIAARRDLHDALEGVPHGTEQ